MKNSNHIEAIAELSESEGVFTTAQAERMGIPRDALYDAAKSGRIERIVRGAYRMVGSKSSYTDELVAIWKLTSPNQFTHERMRIENWDGITVGGSTASSLLEVGDMHLSPYRFFTPKRYNTRNKQASFTKRVISRGDVMFIHGMPVTRLERTILDLVLDDEDHSLIADVLRDAVHKDREFDFKKLSNYFKAQYSEDRAKEIYQGLLMDSGLFDERKK